MGLPVIRQVSSRLGYENAWLGGREDVVDAFVGGDAGRLRTSVEAVYAAMGSGFESTSGNATIDGLFSGGGMASMLPTVWLILAALSFAAIMEHAGLLDRLIAPLVARARTAARLIVTVAGTCIGLNVVAGDQYVADVLPSRVFRGEFARHGHARVRPARRVAELEALADSIAGSATARPVVSAAANASAAGHTRLAAGTAQRGVHVPGTAK